MNRKRCKECFYYGEHYREGHIIHGMFCSLQDQFLVDPYNCPDFIKWEGKE